MERQEEDNGDTRVVIKMMAHPDTGKALEAYMAKLDPKSPEALKHYTTVVNCAAVLEAPIAQLMDSTFMLGLDCGNAAALDYSIAHIDYSEWCWKTIADSFSVVGLDAAELMPGLSNRFVRAQISRKAMVEVAALCRSGVWEGSTFGASATVSATGKTPEEIAREMLDQLDRARLPEASLVKLNRED